MKYYLSIKKSKDYKRIIFCVNDIIKLGQKITKR